MTFRERIFSSVLFGMVIGAIVFSFTGCAHVPNVDAALEKSEQRIADARNAASGADVLLSNFEALCGAMQPPREHPCNSLPAVRTELERFKAAVTAAEAGHQTLDGAWDRLSPMLDVVADAFKGTAK